MRWIKVTPTSVVAATFLLACGCRDSATVDNWPTYEVRGTVRTAAGAPVSSVLVTMETYDARGCGTDPVYEFNSSTTDVEGHYRIRQDVILTDVLDGCLRLSAHPDTTSLSQPTAVVDLPVDSVHVRDGETIFTVDLVVP